MITFSDFQNYFARGEFTYYADYSDTTDYEVDDVVLLSNKWYVCIKGCANTPPPNREYWRRTLKQVEFVSEYEFNKALLQATADFYKVSTDGLNERDTMLLMLLIAHYIVIDNSMNGNGAGVGYGTITSKSISGVSASYNIPQSIMNSPVYSQYTKTGFGSKYLSFVWQYNRGNIAVVKGKVQV